MLYLVHYDRKENKVVTLKEYQEQERPLAYAARLDMERIYARLDGSQEIVLLEAADKAQLRKTHPKYVPDTTAEKIFLGAAVMGVLALLMR
ncbi:MAG: hypothetical protein EAZ37_06985 [Burkholderiales bacterium]|nr:MAG: hypothetical protein EAZ37_06985 [Burkholderiales bacterium]